jgi:hypothetical protein
MNIMSPWQFVMKAPLYDFNNANWQEWNEVSCGLMVKLFVHWIANIWTCTAEREIYDFDSTGCDRNLLLSLIVITF